MNELYNKLDAKDKIINEQALEIAKLNGRLIDVATLIRQLNDLLNIIESGTKKPVEDMKGLYEAIKAGRLEVDITEELYNYLKTYIPTEKSNNPVTSFYGVKLNVKKED